MGKKRKTKKAGWIFGGVVAVAITAFISFYAMRPKDTAFTAVKAKTGDITTYYSFSGNVAAKNRQSLLSEQMMQIAELLVNEGDTVKTGDLLITTTAGEEVKAEVDGEVVNVHVAENELVMPGTRMMEIVDYDNLEIIFKVDEYDVGALETGKEAIAEISALGKEISGKISEISREGQIVNGVTFFTSSMDMVRDENVRIGMSAEVRLISKKAEDVVVLPINVILFDEKNLPYVLKNGDRNMVVEEKITTGINDGTDVEVISGVAKGEEVLFREDVDFERMFFPQGGKNVHLGGVRE